MAEDDFLYHICFEVLFFVQYSWVVFFSPILQIIMLDELEDELLMLDEVSRKENFTLDNLTLLEENDNHTGIQVICRFWIENVPRSRSIFIF